MWWTLYVKQIKWPTKKQIRGSAVRDPFGCLIRDLCRCEKWPPFGWSKGHLAEAGPRSFNASGQITMTRKPELRAFCAICPNISMNTVYIYSTHWWSWIVATGKDFHQQVVYRQIQVSLFPPPTGVSKHLPDSLDVTDLAIQDSQDWISPRNQSSHAQMMSKGCPINSETHSL